MYRVKLQWTSNMGGFLKWGFPTTNDHFGVFWGYHHLRKHPYGKWFSDTFPAWTYVQLSFWGWGWFLSGKACWRRQLRVGGGEVMGSWWNWWGWRRFKGERGRIRPYFRKSFPANFAFGSKPGVVAFKKQPRGFRRCFPNPHGGGCVGCCASRRSSCPLGWHRLAWWRHQSYRCLLGVTAFV